MTTTAAAQFLIGGYTITEIGVAFAAVCTPVLVALVTGYAAMRNAKRSDRTENKRVDLDEFGAFREAYERDMSTMRKDLADLKDQVQRLGGILRRTRSAFRAYIRRVHDDWGRTDQPPVLDVEVQDLLAEDDWNNTLGRATISAAVDEARAENDERDRDHA